MFFLLICAANGIEITTTKPTIECTSQNCIISFDNNMDDEKFDGMISEEHSGILALKFTSCGIEKIPKTTFEKCPSLLCLMITTPGLSKLENGDFVGASDLQFLYLPGNRVRKLLKETFYGAPNINDINLSDNDIEIISEDAFHGLEQLEILNLSRNKIAFLGQSTLSTLVDLTNLDVSGNMIEFLDARLFENNKQLTGINMTNNQILSITNGFLDILPQVKVFNLINNPCTNDTMLEKIPLAKSFDSKDRNIENESFLENCYQNYLNMVDSESTDFDLLDRAETVREDIEANIITDLNEQLRDKDVTIQELTREEDLLKIGILLVITLILFYAILKLIIHVVNTSYHQSEQNQTDCQKKLEVVEVDTKQVIYTIN